MPVLLMKFLRLVRSVLGLARRHIILTVKSVDFLLRVFISYRYQSLRPYLAGCDECLILGNGPSLNEAIKYLSVIRQGRDVFCVNFFAMTDYYSDIKPSHYVLFDNGFWIDDVPDKMSQKRDELFDKIEKTTDWPMVIFVPHAAKASRTWSSRSNFSNLNISMCYYNIASIGSVNTYSYLNYLLYKYNVGIPFAVNVLMPTILLAINFGYKKTFLFGADHSWHENIFVGSDNVLYIKHEHFYDQRVTASPRFSGDGRKKYKIHEIFNIFSQVFKGHILLEEYARQRGAKIYNASSKSCIDAYERIAVTDIQLIS